MPSSHAKEVVFYVWGRIEKTKDKYPSNNNPCDVDINLLKYHSHPSYP